jgi:thiamine pyrophosphate-dependent acetolactate synthase large subunit-like protein
VKVRATRGLVRILKAEGVDWISVFPSSGLNTPCGDEGITNRMMRDERFAVAVADGFSRVSDRKRFGVCAMQGGLNAVGAQYAYGAIAQAYEDNTPILCLTDGIQTPIAGVKRFDITEAFQSVTKWTGYINKAHRVPEFMTRAYTALRSGRPGPVLLQIPNDLDEFEELEYPYTPPKGWRQQADPRDVEIAVRSLLAAKQPMLYAGQGIFYADACAELLEFAELVQAPVLTTLKGKSAFPENHALSIGVKGAPAERFLNGSDLIFALGASLTPGRRYGGFLHQLPETKRSDLIPAQARKTVIQCTDAPEDVNRYYQVDHAVLGDLQLVLRQLIAEVQRQTRSGAPRQAPVAEIEAAKQEHRAKYTPFLTSNDTPINPYRVYGDLMKTLDMEHSLVTHDSGSTREQLATVYTPHVPHGFLGWGLVSTLGFGLGAAIGAKMAFPTRQVVNVAGDAGVGYQLGNYEALVRNGIGITTIHINNSGFAGYGPGFWGSGSNPYVSAVTPSTQLNMAKAVEALGEYAERVEDPDEVIPALKRALKENAAGRPAYLEFICSQFPVVGPWLVK